MGIMARVRRWLRGGPSELQTEHIKLDQAHVEARARRDRANQVTSRLEDRVYRDNHIAQAIHSLWTGGKA